MTRRVAAQQPNMNGFGLYCPLQHRLAWCHRPNSPKQASLSQAPVVQHVVAVVSCSVRQTRRSSPLRPAPRTWKVCPSSMDVAPCRGCDPRCLCATLARVLRAHKDTPSNRLRSAYQRCSTHPTSYTSSCSSDYLHHPQTLFLNLRALRIRSHATPG